MDIKEYNWKTELSKRHPWEQSRLSVAIKLIQTGLRKAPDTILDIGSGDSYVIGELNKKWANAKCYAVDNAYNDKLFSVLNKEYSGCKIHYYKSITNTFSQVNSEIDIVLLLDVIEHIENVEEFFTELHHHPKITENTIFVITVPALQSLFSKHDYALGHYRRYNRKLLREQIQNSGLKVQKSGYFYFLLLLPRIMQVTKEKLIINKKDTKSDLVKWNKGRFITSVIKNILNLDFYFSFLLKKVGINIIGLSCYGLCKLSNKN